MTNYTLGFDVKDLSIRHERIQRSMDQKCDRGNSQSIFHRLPEEKKSREVIKI